MKAGRWLGGCPAAALSNQGCLPARSAARRAAPTPLPTHSSTATTTTTTTTTARPPTHPGGEVDVAQQAPQLGGIHRGHLPERLPLLVAPREALDAVAIAVPAATGGRAGNQGAVVAEAASAGARGSREGSWETSHGAHHTSAVSRAALSSPARKPPSRKGPPACTAGTGWREALKAWVRLATCCTRACRSAATAPPAPVGAAPLAAPPPLLICSG